MAETEQNALREAQDRSYMRLAVKLAEHGRGRTNPNPVVGAVIVKDDRILGVGYHARYGDLHAERAALGNCTDPTEGATLYVTLEPCCHHGNQPPCTDAILQAGIRRVVIGSDDPNPLVAGQGVRILRDNGVRVETGFMREECDALNPVFFHYIRTGRPYVILKYAMTLDGKIATRTGASRWITGEAARKRVHEDRNRYAAVLVGAGTVAADDPLLTCRLENGRNPVRIVCDSALRTVPESQLVRTARETRTIFAAARPDPERRAALESLGCEVWELADDGGRVDLCALMDRIGAEKLDSVIAEGGASLNWSLLRAGLVQRVQAYIAPKLFGGAAAKSPVAGEGVETPDGAFSLRDVTLTPLDGDFLLEGVIAEG
ncbi:MAG: bifunctional diaminohydroxyphosphoribosylaminopyrimidine deaminase/5-amino-6-(5-phosphoribosylamino)uracil reductase RibD [Oscillibacter sp.]|nr:bifunctional diaminohydroxyphosphoribosylaminopyrimidine deaminase/5-amino-6-(5-phosphoribosylamino)uracil reductase RibD [Oscillibacter sp.]